MNQVLGYLRLKYIIKVDKFVIPWNQVKVFTVYDNHLIHIYCVMKNNKNLPLNDPRHYVRQCMTVHVMTQSRKNTKSLKLNYDMSSTCFISFSRSFSQIIKLNRDDNENGVTCQKYNFQFREIMSLQTVSQHNIHFMLFIIIIFSSFDIYIAKSFLYYRYCMYNHMTNWLLDYRTADDVVVVADKKLMVWVHYWHFVAKN